MSRGPLAIISGKGLLPEMLSKTAKRDGRDVVLVCFGDFRPDWHTDEHLIQAAFEKPGAMFKALAKSGCTEIVFAGYIKRPRLNPLKFDLKMLSLAAQLIPTLKSGDSTALDTIVSVFQAEGIKVLGAHEILSELLSPNGTLTKTKPSDDDLKDIERAKEIVLQMGVADVGQGAVVAQGLCLGIESIQGTDAMLEFVANTSTDYRSDETAGKGVLLKAPKLGQDWRVDLPAIGPHTVANAAKAGLSGIAVQAGAVLILGMNETVQAANEHGLFIHAYEAS